jgi:hypothetical protein
MLRCRIAQYPITRRRPADRLQSQVRIVVYWLHRTTQLTVIGLNRIVSLIEQPLFRVNVLQHHGQSLFQQQQATRINGIDDGDHHQRHTKYTTNLAPLITELATKYQHHIKSDAVIAQLLRLHNTIVECRDHQSTTTSTSINTDSSSSGGNAHDAPSLPTHTLESVLVHIANTIDQKYADAYHSVLLHWLQVVQLGIGTGRFVVHLTLMMAIH